MAEPAGVSSTREERGIGELWAMESATQRLGRGYTCSYAHGLPRLLSNQMQLSIEDALYEQVGSITMISPLFGLVRIKFH